MLYINWKINQRWLHWYKNSKNSLNGYRVIVSIATLPISTRGTSKFYFYYEYDVVCID